MSSTRTRLSRGRWRPLDALVAQQPRDRRGMIGERFLLQPQRDRKKLTSVYHHSLHPIQPAALVAWIAKRYDAETSGRKLLAHAVFIASQVAELRAPSPCLDRVWRRAHAEMIV